MSICRVFSCAVGRGCLLWQNSISLCPASFRISRPNLPITPGVSWLPTFAFHSPITKSISWGALALEGLLGLQRTVQLQLLQHYCIETWNVRSMNPKNLNLVISIDWAWWRCQQGHMTYVFIWEFWDSEDVNVPWIIEFVIGESSSSGFGSNSMKCVLHLVSPHFIHRQAVYVGS